MVNEENSPKADLRPVVARLREIERKCQSMSSRSEEFPLMQERVAGMISRLEAGEEGDGAPLDFRRMARELFPVAHLFESTGFMSVGKEISYIERSLTDLAPDSGTDVAPSSKPSPRGFVASSAAKTTVEQPPEPEDDETETRSTPLPVIVGFGVLVLALLGAAAVIVGVGPFERWRPPISVRATPPAAPPTVAVQPTPIPVTSPTPPPLRPPTAVPRGRLAAEVASARLALAKGELEEAAAHLSEAARIDRREPDLKEIAQQVVNGLVSWAYAAAHNAEWDEAEPHLERAERTAMRFGLDTTRIETARTRIAAMERFVIVDPGDRRTIQASIGERAEITLTDNSTLTGRIEGIAGGDLVLDMDNRVGGGAVRYTEEIPLSSIRSIKIFEN